MPTAKRQPETRLPQRPKDATNTGGLRRSYQTQLYGLFKKFEDRLSTRVDRLLKRVGAEYTVNNFISPGFLKEFGEKIDEVNSAVMRAGSKRIIDDHITRSFKRGKDVAVSNPRLERESIIISSNLSRTDNLAIDDLRIRNFNLINDDSIKKSLLQIMTDDIRQGKGTNEIARDIRNSILDIGMNRSKTIARTEIAFSYNSAIAKTYQDADINKWQWLSAMGETTCQECSSRHGNQYDWSDEQPPIHPNCLCTIYPIVDRAFQRPGEEGEPAEIEPRPDLNPHKPESSEPLETVAEKIQKNLYDFEETIRKNTYETGRIVDINGGEIATVTQHNPHQVDWSGELKTFEEHKSSGDLSVTHNHPIHEIAGGKLISSFSPDDIYFAANKNLQKIE